MVLLRLGLKGVKYFGTFRNFAFMLFYQMHIQIYDQTSIIRNCSKVKLRHAFSLGLGLKVVKIAWNVAKVGVHACLSNGHPNLWSNFNSKNLVKSETPSWGSLTLGLNEGKIDLNIMKFGMHYYLPNGHLNLRLNFNFEKLVKSKTSSCGFAKVALKGSENSFKRRESWRARLFVEMGT